MSGADGLQELHAADLELIGEGGNSRVYRLEGNKVVKVFHKDIPKDMVCYENDRSCEPQDLHARPASGWSVWTAAWVLYMKTLVPGICFP